VTLFLFSPCQLLKERMERVDIEKKVHLGGRVLLLIINMMQGSNILWSDDQYPAGESVCRSTHTHTVPVYFQMVLSTVCIICVCVCVRLHKSLP